MAKESAVSTKKRRGRKPVKGLTPAQKRTLEAIIEFQDKQGYPPSIKELGDFLNITAAGAHDQVDQLMRKGFVVREARKARSLTVLKMPDSRSPVSIEAMHSGEGDLVPIPVVNHAAKRLELFEPKNILGEILINPTVGCVNHCFAVEIKSDELVGADIYPGDILICRCQPLAENGDIVIASLDDKILVNRLYIRDSVIELRADNPKYPPVRIRCKDDLKIIGKMVGVKRFPITGSDDNA